MRTIRLMPALTVIAALVAAPCAWAQGTAFTYQGQLDDGGPPANGSYDMEFEIWNASSGGSQVGGTTLSFFGIPVDGGLFEVELDFGPAVFNGADRYLQIGVVTNGGGAFTTLTPRTKITSTPYAIRAATAASVVGGINDADADPSNELNTSVNLVGTTLQVNDAGGTKSASLASLVDDSDWAYNSGSGLSGEIYHSGDVALGTITDPDGHGLNVQNYTTGHAAVRGADQSGSSVYAVGYLGVLEPTTGSLGIPISTVNAGVVGIKPNLGGDGIGVMGWNNDAGSVNYGGAFVADGANALDYSNDDLRRATASNTTCFAPITLPRGAVQVLGLTI